MKNLVLKTTALVIVFSFLLCGCANKKADVSYISDVKETNSLLVVSEKTDASETEDATSDEDAIGETEPEWLGQNFAYYSYDDTTPNYLIKWAKESKIDEANEYNKHFLSWAKSNNELIVPKIKKDVYKFHACTVMPDSAGYRFVYFAGENYNPVKESTVQILILPLSDLEKDLPLLEIIEKYRYEYKKYPNEILHNSTKIKQGANIIKEYYTTVVDDKAKAFYKTSQYFISVAVYGGKGLECEWKDEYFDIFEFETVSLK